MPFTLRFYRRLPVQCFVTYYAILTTMVWSGSFSPISQLQTVASLPTRSKNLSTLRSLPNATMHLYLLY
jgi:hypothetical protein